MPIDQSPLLVATRIARQLRCLMCVGAFFASNRVTIATELAATVARNNVPAPRTLALRGQRVMEIGFEHLASFPYTIVDAGTGASAAQIDEARKHDQVPAPVRACDAKRVALTGFMLPLQLENGRAKKLILMRDVSTCCYGATPNMNDYVVITMKGDGVPPLQDVPVMFVGMLHIGERYENGYLVSLYELDGEKYLGPVK